MQLLVIKLFYTERYSLKQIVKILDIGAVSVKSRLFKTIEELKNRNYERY
ncbi:MAG: hypothetical protein HRT68_10675 [Flavobacteriaceae bacterium]|nr:hypothetical protein [Flavobacteriaceae bacterium]